MLQPTITTKSYIIKLSVGASTRMKNTGSRNFYLLLSTLVLAIFLVSPLSVFGQGSSQAQWVGPMGNYPFNWNYVNQDQISASNLSSGHRSRGTSDTMTPSLPTWSLTKEAES